MNNIYLVGMMGCGKSTVGRNLAKHTGLKFIDLDKYIEKQQNCSINDIFQNNGEVHFRDLETQALYDASKNHRHIISCGGGIVLREENIAAMKRTGKIVYIERTPENTLRTLKTKNRPLLKDGGDSFKRLYDIRKPIYENSADIKVTNNTVAKDAVFQIIKLLPNLFEKE